MASQIYTLKFYIDNRETSERSCFLRKGFERLFKEIDLKENLEF